MTTSKKAGIILLGNVVTTTTQAILVIILARWLDKETVGSVFKIFLIYKTAIVLGNLGLTDNPYYFIPRLRPDQYGTFFRQCLAVLLMAGTVTGLLAFGIFQLYVGRLWVSIAFLPIIVLELSTSIAPDFLIAVGRVRAASILNILFSILYLGVATVACLFGEDPVSRLSFGLLGYSVVRAIVTLWILTSFRSARSPLPNGLFRQQMSFGIPLGLSTGMYRINKQVDNYVVAGFFNNATFAEYSVGSWEIPMLLKIPYSITTAYMTKYAAWFNEGNLDALHKKWLAVSEKIILLLVPIASFFLIFAPEVIHTLFGSQYHQAVVVFQIFTLTLFTRVGSYTGLLKAMGDSTYVLQNSIQLFLLNLAFNFIGVMTMGLYGAAVGALIANVVTLVLALRRLSVHLKQSVRHLMPFAFHFKVSATSLTICLGLKLVLSRSGMGETTVLLSAIPLYLLLFIAIGSVLHIIQGPDRKYLLSYFRNETTNHA